MTSSNEDEPPKKIPMKFKLFKLYDFNVYDGFSKQTDFDKSNFDPYKDNKKFIIQMFGINSSGQTGSILVEDFNPFFYIKVGDNWTDSTRTEFIGHIKKKMGNYYEDSIVESKLIKKQKLYGFDDHKLHNFVRISFTNNGAFNKAKKMFYKDTFENGYFNRELIKDGYIYQNTNCYLYEANIPPLLKLFHLQEISPSGWVLLPSNKVKTVNKKTTHCAYEYIISHKHIKKADKDDIVKYNICSFDIEASSSHGDFPVPIKDYKKLATNILQYYNELQDKENYDCELFEKQIYAAFCYQDINYIDKVYPKLKQIGKEQLNNIFDNFIKYIPANDKTRKDYTLEIEESDSESDNDESNNENNIMNNTII